MVDSTESSIVISATVPEVLAVIADFEAYPEWTGAVRQVSILEREPDGRGSVVKFTLDAGALKDTYSLAYTWDVTRGAGGEVTSAVLSWKLVEATLLKAMTGAYRLSAQGPEATNVVYALSVDLHIPMLGMLRRRAEKVITDTALTELKRRVES